MPGMIFPVLYEMEDGTEGEVRTDQRDIAAFEREYAHLGATPEAIKHTTTRYMCWNALRRRKETTLSWKDWDDACIEVKDAPAVVADPTRPASSGDS